MRIGSRSVLKLPAVLLLSVAVAAVMSCKGSSTSSLSAEVKGVIVDAEGLVIVGATITVQGTDFTGVTDADGCFDVKIEPGDYVLLVTAPGYGQSDPIPFSVAEGETWGGCIGDPEPLKLVLRPQTLTGTPTPTRTPASNATPTPASNSTPTPTPTPSIFTEVVGGAFGYPFCHGALVQDWWDFNLDGGATCWWSLEVWNHSSVDMIRVELYTADGICHYGEAQPKDSVLFMFQINVVGGTYTVCLMGPEGLGPYEITVTAPDPPQLTITGNDVCRPDGPLCVR